MFLIVLFIILFINFFFIFKYKKYLRKCYNSRAEVSRLGNNIALIGATGDGKTTTSAGITCYLIEYILYECKNRMEEIRLKLPNIDFNKICCIFVNTLEETNSFNLALNNSLRSVEKDDNLLYFVHDFINMDQKYKLLIDYIGYFFILNSPYHVFSKGYFYDRVKNRTALLFDPSSIALREVLKNRNFQLDIGKIIFNDETSIERGNVYSNDKSVKMDGTVEFFALLRNMFKGLTFNISMKQISDNEVKLHRRTINSSLQIFDRKEINIFKLFIFLINVTKSILDLFIKIYILFSNLVKRLINNIFRKEFIFQDFEYFKNKSTWYRRVEFFLFKFKKILLSFNFIRVRLYKYYSSEDVGKRTKGTYDCLVLYFPIYYVYGLVNTYEYYDTAYPLFNAARTKSINNIIINSDTHTRIERFKRTFMKYFEEEDR